MPRPQLMIIYWAHSSTGCGIGARAAAICRHLPDVLVVTSARGNEMLDRFDIATIKIPDEADARRWVEAHRDGPVIVDSDPAGFEHIADLFIWRLGRRRSGVATVDIEGVGAHGPMLVLDRVEILSRADARRDLGVDDDRPLTVLVPSATRPGDVCGAHDIVLDQWPALRWLPAADRVLGMCGANLYGEVGYLGLEAEWQTGSRAADMKTRLTQRPLIRRNADGAARVAAMIKALP